MGDAAKEREYHRKGREEQLALDAWVSGWPTVQARDWKGPQGRASTGTNPDGSERDRTDQLPRKVYAAFGATEDGTNAATGKPEGFRLNPGFSLYLQLGTTRAIEWLRCVELAMRSV
jgi:hypothetical protein